MNIQLWSLRSDAETVVIFSPVIDVSAVRDVTILLNIVGIGAVNVTLQGQHSLDPNDPNSWSNIGTTAVGVGTGNTAGLAGGYSGGSTVPMGPFFRARATITVTTGAVVWSANAVLRECA